METAAEKGQVKVTQREPKRGQVGGGEVGREIEWEETEMGERPRGRAGRDKERELRAKRGRDRGSMWLPGERMR